MPIKRFKQFLMEDRIKLYFIKIEPYTKDGELVEPLANMMSWIKEHIDNGQGIKITARPWDNCSDD